METKTDVSAQVPKQILSKLPTRKHPGRVVKKAVERNRLACEVKKNH